jgi:hypothetical protein
MCSFSSSAGPCSVSPEPESGVDPGCSHDLLGSKPRWTGGARWIDEGAVWVETAMPKESASAKPAGPAGPELPKNFKPSGHAGDYDSGVTALIPQR